jgi:2-methylcitrate dehydratase PrpD
VSDTNIRKLARFVTGLKFTDLPESVVVKATEVALNSWGVQLAASTLPWSKSSYRYGRSQGGTPESTVLTYGFRTTASNAAFINGCFAHGFELDDIHAPTGVKGGCVTIPTAFAVGERQLSSGQDFLTAVVAAYEVMTRVNLSGYQTLHGKGHHSTGHVGALGAAAITSKLLDFDEDLTCHALAIATVQMVGLQFSGADARSDRGYLKRTYGGTCNVNGIRSALLAREGMTSSDVMLEPGAGFCRAFDVDEENAKKITAGLGDDWEILRAHYKVFAQDGHIQPMTEGLRRIRRAHQFTAAEVESVHVGTNRIAHDLIVGQIREPKDLTDAQYSAYFSLALYLVKGAAGFREYTQDNLLADKEILDLSRRVSLDVDPEIEAEYQRTHPRGARVTVRLRSGEEFVEQVDNLPEMTPDEIDDKFRDLTTVVLPTDRSEALLHRVRHIDEVRNVAELAPMFVP